MCKTFMRIFIFICCFSVLFAKSSNIMLNHRFKIGGGDSDLIYRWAGLCTDDEENIYITDMMDYSIKKFDKNGKFITKAGRKGEGPGEFRSIGWIVYCHGKLYISQQMSPGLSIFSKELLFQKNISYKLAIISMVAHNNKVFISSSSAIDNPSKITSITDDGVLEHGIIPMRNTQNQPKNKEMWQYFNDMLAFDVGDDLAFYCAYSFINRIAKFDKQHRLQKQVSLPQFGNNPQFQNEQSLEANLPKDIFFKDIALDSKGNIFLLCGPMLKNDKQTIFILNKELEHISILYLKENSHTLHISKSNRLYVRAEGGMAIDVYEIKY